MRAFLTGSHAYGTPTPESDVDLVVFMSGADANRLAELADSYAGSTGDSLCFGKLNLLLFFDEWKFEAWRAGTEALKARKPVTREEAIAELERQEDARKPT